MLGRTHATSGAVAVLALVPVLREHGVAVDGWAIPVAAVVGAGAAMLPDLDHRHGTIARSVGPVSWFVSRVVGAASGGHRNGTHSLLGIACFIGFAALLTQIGGLPLGLFLAFLFAVASAALRLNMVRATVGHTVMCLVVGALLARGALMDSFQVEVVPWAVAIGASAHVLGDMATVQGCPLFWPVHRHRFNYARLSTDHLTERLVVGPALGLAAAWLTFSLAGGVEVFGPWFDATLDRVWAPDADPGLVTPPEAMPDGGAGT